MKKIYLTFTFLLTLATLSAQTVFINELHYDNIGGDVNEGVEIAGPAGTDLTDWMLVPYNGNGGTSYSALTLSGTIPDQMSGFGTLFFAITGLQNGAPDGVALVNAGGTVIQFLSYEGAFMAADGPAAGTMSTDIGVAESNSTTLETESLQLIGAGMTYADFTWNTPMASTYNAVNTDQTFGATAGVDDTNAVNFVMTPNPVTNGIVTITGVQNAKVAVYNLLGKQVLAQNITNSAISTGALQSGIYLVKVTQDNATSTQKLIVR